MITIASHDGQNNVIKAINKYLIQNIRTRDDVQMLFASLHGKLFAMYNEHKPNYVIWPVSEYTQEVQDFIAEYTVGVKVILIIDTEIPQQELDQYFNSRDNMAFIVDETITKEYRNTITKYGRMYDDDVYHASDLERNDKIVALLSTDNDKNRRMLDEIIYPNNKHDHKVVVVNNPEYDSPVNVGVFNYYDLAFILKTFDKVIDIDKIFQLESQACGIKYLDIGNEDILDTINNNKYSQDIDNLSEHTYNHFVKEEFLPYLIRK
tara:strand:+ start:5217 stop:6008 length:792 start_codon:yes stop_codon:yes gene_type:complete